MGQFAILKDQVGQKASGQLAIGTPPAWQQVVTSPFVEKLSSQFPSIALRIHEGVSTVLRDYMSAGLLDIAIVPNDAPPMANYRKSSLVREPMVLVGGARGPLNPGHPVNVSKLDGLPLVLPGRPNVARIQVERVLENKGMQFRLAVETDTLSLCLDLARRGAAFTVVPASSLHVQRADDVISWAPVKGLHVTWAFCENVDRMHSQAVREGRKLFLNEVSEVLRSKSWFGVERVKGGSV